MGATLPTNKHTQPPPPNLHRALEGLAKLVGSLADCQQAYASSLDSAAKLTLAGDCDGASMRPAMAALAALPQAMGAAHGQLAALLRGLAEGVRQLLREYQSACREIRGGAATVQRGIESGRRQLAGAFEEHKAVCEGFDVAAGRSGPRARLIKGPEHDPWATEGRLVRGHRSLQLWQVGRGAFAGFVGVGCVEDGMHHAAAKATSSTCTPHRKTKTPTGQGARVPERVLRARPDA